MIRILVFADDVSYSSGLQKVLNREDMGIVGAGSDIRSLLRDSSRAEILLIQSDRSPSPELREWLNHSEAPPAVLVVSSKSSTVRAYSRLPFSNWGALPPNARGTSLAAAIRCLAEGLTVADPGLIDGGSKEISLSPREKEVIGLKEIADDLGISENTVKFHVTSLYGKLGAGNRIEAIREGIRLGLLTL